MFLNNELRAVVENMRNDDILGCSTNEKGKFKIIEVKKRRLSTVYYVNIDSTSAQSKKVYIKIAKYANGERDAAGEKLKQEYDRHLDAYTKLPRSSEFTIVRPLCVYPDVPAIVTNPFPDSEQLKAPIIRYLILGGRKRKNDIQQLLYSTGGMLKKFHKPYMQDIENLDKIQVELGEYISLRLELIDEFLAGSNVVFRPTLVSMFDRFMKKTTLKFCRGVNMMGMTHGDFTPGNVLYDGEKLALIDFSEAAYAPLARDVGGFINYLNMLSLNKPILSSKKGRHLVEAFIEGYGKQSEMEVKFRKQYQFRFLTTNLLTQIREMENSSFRGALMSRRIGRYLKKMESVLTSVV